MISNFAFLIALLSLSTIRNLALCLLSFSASSCFSIVPAVVTHSVSESFSFPSLSTYPGALISSLYFTPTLRLYFPFPPLFTSVPSGASILIVGFGTDFPVLMSLTAKSTSTGAGAPLSFMWKVFSTSAGALSSIMVLLVMLKSFPLYILRVTSKSTSPAERSFIFSDLVLAA